MHIVLKKHNSFVVQKFKIFESGVSELISQHFYHILIQHI